MTTFWSWYITLLTLGSLLALLWLIFATRSGEQPGPTDQTLGHAFDGIEEYDNPLPRWWFMLFLGTLIFAGAYLLLYPGLGNFAGKLPGYEGGWTQVKQWQREMDKADAEYGPIYASYAKMPVEDVAKDERALKMGGRLFASNCSVCHGSDAKGAYGFPNLTDKEWRWGGDAASIKQTIAGGRTGMMPPQAAMIGEESEQLLARIVALHHGVADVRAVETGDEDFGGVEAKTGDDLLPRQLVGRRGERDARDVRITFVQLGELDVLGAEIVAPLRHAMRFVNGDQRNRHTTGERAETFGFQTFRSHIQQSDPSRQRLCEHQILFVGTLRGIDERG